MAHFLIENGADVNIANGQGWMPVHLAVWGPPELMAFVLDHGADINAVKEYDQETPLHMAVQTRYPKLELVELLLRRGTDRTLINRQGQTARDLAVQNQQTEIIAVFDAVPAPVVKIQDDSLKE